MLALRAWPAERGTALGATPGLSNRFYGASVVRPSGIGVGAVTL